MEIIAHRGASAYAPENTLAAFKKALEYPIAGIELDVQLTKDDQLVVIHDFFIDRTTKGSGLVMETDYQVMKELDAGSWFNESFSDERIPLFEDVLKLVPNHIMLYVEIKKLMLDRRPIEEDVYKMVSKYRRPDEVKYSSFDHDIVYNLKRFNEKNQIAVLVKSKIKGIVNYVNNVGIDCVSINQSAEFVSPELVHEIHEDKKKLLSYTVNYKRIAHYFKEIGVDGIFTNYPDILD